jgi:hypothetical protein
MTAAKSAPFWAQTTATVRRRTVLPPSRYARPHSVSSDPSVRRDGRCQVCGGVRPQLAVEHGDPFFPRAGRR